MYHEREEDQYDVFFNELINIETPEALRVTELHGKTGGAWNKWIIDARKPHDGTIDNAGPIYNAYAHSWKAVDNKFGILE